MLQIVQKIKPKHIKSFENSFLELVAHKVLAHDLDKSPLLYEKLYEYKKYKAIDDSLLDITNQACDLIDFMKKSKSGKLDKKKLDSLRKPIYQFLGLL